MGLVGGWGWLEGGAGWREGEGGAGGQGGAGTCQVRVHGGMRRERLGPP